MSEYTLIMEALHHNHAKSGHMFLVTLSGNRKAVQTVQDYGTNGNAPSKLGDNQVWLQTISANCDWERAELLVPA